MTQHTLHSSAALPGVRLRAGWVARIEQAFVRWQAARLQEIPAGKLWAQAMQDTRSLAEIRRSCR